MEIHRGDTLSGFVVTASDGGFEMTLYKNDATFSDGNGEIIVDGLPEYNIETVTDAEVTQMFSFAKIHYDNFKAYMSQLEEE